MIVSADHAELAAEFRKRGVRPGSRLHVTVSDPPEPSAAEWPAYFGSFDGPDDLAEKSEEILRAEFPAARRRS